MSGRNVVIHIMVSLVAHCFLLIPGNSGIYTGMVFIVVPPGIIGSLVEILLEWSIGLLQSPHRGRGSHVVLVMGWVTVIEGVVHVEVSHGLGLVVVFPRVARMRLAMGGVRGLVSEVSSTGHHGIA